MAKKSKKILLIVESPNKLSTISKYLKDLDSEFILRASVGHIMELADSHKFGIDIENGYEPKYKIIPEKKDVLKSIIDAANGVSEILIASDKDFEGEAIAFHLKDCLDTNSAIIKRITFNEITKAAILKAINNPDKFNQNLYDAQKARRCIDRFTGFTVSPYISQTVGKGEKSGLSAGRVQSVAVRLVSEREEEILNFIPEEYWNIFSTLSKKNALSETFEAKLIKKIANKNEADKIKLELESDQYIVTLVDAKEKKRNPLPPLTTAKLQQIVSSRYGISIKRIIDAAQKIYELGYCTYIRTDSVRSSPESIADVRNWLTENKYIVPKTPNIYESKANSADAHEAIRPSYVDKTPDNINLDGDLIKVYRVIWERFVASQMEPALYDTVAIAIKTSSGHELRASGRVLKYSGWLSIATDQASVKSDSEDDIQLPILKAGDNLILVAPKIKAEQKFSQPPPRIGEAGIIRELEKRGIGRPSTYGKIIQNICEKKYVNLINKVYHGTEIGKQIVDKLKDHFSFIEYDYTANMEEQLDLIAEGKLKYIDMLDAFYKNLQKEVKNAYNDKNEASRTDILCSKCNSSHMLIKHGQYGYYLSCADTDCKNNISCEVDGNGKAIIKQNKQVEPGISCPKCSGDMSKKDGKFGPYYACLDFKCGGKGKVPYGKKCPRCSEELFLTIYGADSVLFCMGYAKTGCNYKENLPPEEQISNPKDFNSGDGLPKNIKRILKKSNKKS